MHKKSVLLSVLLFLTMLLSFPAYAADTNIACIIPCYPDIMFWSDINDSMHQAATDLGIDLMMLYTRHPEPNMELNLNEALSIAIYSNADAIITSYTLADIQTEHWLETAKEKGIPVILIDCDGPENLRTAYIGIDNESAGYEIGIRAQNELSKNEKSLLVYSSTSLEHENLHQRIQGVQEAFAQNPDWLLEYVIDDFGITDILAIRQLLKEYPEITSIIAINENSTLLCARVLDADSNHSDIRLYGFDESEQTLTLLNNGSIDTLVCQSHQEMGYQSVVTAQALTQDHTDVDDIHLIDFVIREHSRQ